MERRTIVVVEDEPIQRMGAAAAFHDFGYETAEFDNAEDAAGYVMKNEPGILAVFTDVRMPGDLDGVNLAAQIAFGCPKIALLVTSGQAEGILERLPPNGYFVPKPWISTDLGGAIEEMQNRQRAKA